MSREPSRIEPPVDPDEDFAAESVAFWQSQVEESTTRHAMITRNHTQAIHSERETLHHTWSNRIRAQVEELALKLTRKPNSSTHALEETAQGCRWKIRHWQRLVQVFEFSLTWTPEDLRLTFQLLGLPTDPTHHDLHALSLLHKFQQARGPAAESPAHSARPVPPPPSPAVLNALREILAAEGSPLADPALSDKLRAEANEWLLALANQERDRLHKRLAEAETTDQARYQLEFQLVEVGLEGRGSRLRRLEREARLDLQRDYKNYERARKAAAPKAQRTRPQEHPQNHRHFPRTRTTARFHRVNPQATLAIGTGTHPGPLRGPLEGRFKALIAKESHQMPQIRPREFRKAILSNGFLATAFLLLALPPLVAAQPEVIPLWPEGAPGAVGTEDLDIPTLTLTRPDPAIDNGAAIVVCPGGGYGMLAMDHEGHEVARWLNSIGVTAAVLKYRLGPRYHHPAPLQDAQRTVQIVRSRASDWGVDPNRIGILGFSAGGHLASTAATHHAQGNPEASDPVETVSSRPDIAILVYPVVALATEYGHAGSLKNLLGDSPDPALVENLSNERQVDASTPPTFLAHTNADTGVPAENSLLFALALRKANVPVELHLFEAGQHGLGLGTGASQFNIAPDRSFSAWPGLCERWLRARGFLTRPN